MEKTIIENNILNYITVFDKGNKSIIIDRDAAISWIKYMYSKKENFEPDPKLNCLNIKYKRISSITGNEAKKDLSLIMSVLSTKNIDKKYIHKINHVSQFIGDDIRYTTKARNDIFNFMEMFLHFITLLGEIKNIKERNDILEKFPPTDTNYGCIQALTAILKRELMLMECDGSEVFLLKSHEFCIQEMVNYIGYVNSAHTTSDKKKVGENAHIPSALNIVLGIDMAVVDPIGNLVIRKLDDFWIKTWDNSYEKRLNNKLKKLLQEDLDEFREIFADDLNDNYPNIKELLLIRGIHIEKCIELLEDCVTVVWNQEKIKNILIQRYEFCNKGKKSQCAQNNKVIDTSNFRLFYRGDSRNYKIIFKEGFQIGETFEGVNTSGKIKLARDFLRGGCVFGFVSDLNKDKNFSGDGEMYSEHYIFKSVSSNQIAFVIIDNRIVFNPKFNVLDILELINLIKKNPEINNLEHMSLSLFEETYRK